MLAKLSLIDPSAKYGILKLLSLFFRLVLDINQTNKKVITYTSHGGINQKWHFDNDGVIRSETGLVLDVKSSNCNERAEVIAHTRHGGNNQKFRRINVQN